MVLDECSGAPVFSLLLRSLRLLLEIALEDLEEELRELLRVLLLAAVELEGVDERGWVVNGLLGPLKESEEDSELEDRMRLREELGSIEEERGKDESQRTSTFPFDGSRHE